MENFKIDSVIVLSRRTDRVTVTINFVTDSPKAEVPYVQEIEDYVHNTFAKKQWNAPKLKENTNISANINDFNFLTDKEQEIRDLWQSIVLKSIESGRSPYQACEHADVVIAEFSKFFE